MLRNLIAPVASAIIVAVLAVNVLVPRVATEIINSASFGGAVETVKVKLGKGFEALADSSVSGGRLVVDGFTQGGGDDGCTTLTDANGGTYTLTEAEMLATNCFEFAAGGAGQEVIALTLPATSTLTTLLKDSGDFAEWVYDASALAAATTTTVTAGTGVNLIGVTVNDDVIDGAEFARISCWRQADTDVACITSELINVD